MPASELGITRVWVNRLAEPDDPARAHAVLADLNDLVTTVEAVAAGGPPSG